MVTQIFHIFYSKYLQFNSGKNSQIITNMNGFKINQRYLVTKLELNNLFGAVEKNN